jgi:hypothetical protein
VWDLWLDHKCSSPLLNLCTTNYSILSFSILKVLYEKLFRVLVESTNVLISYDSPFCNLCWDKDRSEPFNSDTQDGGGKQKIKGKQLAKQERSIAWNWEASNQHQDPASLKLQAHTQSHLKILHHKRAEHQESSVVRGAANLTPYSIQNHLWQKDTRPPRVSPRLSSTRALWPHFQPLAWEHVWGQLALESNTAVQDLLLIRDHRVCELREESLQFVSTFFLIPSSV